MSAPEPGSVSSGNLGLPATTGQPVIHTMQLSFDSDGTAVYKPVTGNPVSPFSVRPAGNGYGTSGGEQVKKKRGRPRKYVPEGGSHSLQPPRQQQAPRHPPPTQDQAPHHPPAQNQPPPQNHHQQPQLQGVVQGGGALESSVKKRGSASGSVNKKQHLDHHPQQQQQQQQFDDMGSPGIGFTPHVITVNTGEDVSSKIMSFSQNGPRAICILSANGTISSVTLRQAATSGGSVTYEGRFEILSLSGSFMVSENGGGRSRTGGLSVSLAGPDGRVVGGGVAGLLIAASPLQVVVGSFIPDGRKGPKIPSSIEPLFTPSRPHSSTGPPRPSSPPSHGSLSESSDGPDSPLNRSAPPGLADLPWK